MMLKYLFLTTIDQLYLFKVLSYSIPNIIGKNMKVWTSKLLIYITFNLNFRVLDQGYWRCA